MDDKNINDILDRLAAQSVPDDVAELARKASDQFERQLRQSSRPNFLEQIMKSKLTKMAAAAAIIVAALVGLGILTNGSITYGQVIKPLLDARTAVLDIIVGDDPDAVVIHDVVIGSKIRRTFSNIDNIMILDLDSRRMLALYPPAGTAIELDISGAITEGTRHFLREVRTIVEQTRNNPDVIELGESEIDGRAVVGFRLNDPSQLTIYADADTALPVRIERTISGVRTTLSNIRLDPSLDPDLVDMTLPAGYTMQNVSFDMSGFNEQDLIETLRIWAEIINDGVFPDDINSEAQMKVMPTLIEKLSQMTDRTPEQLTEIGVTFGRGMVFHQMLTRQGRWRYTGAGVKAGAPDTEIARFKPPNSNTWRIIYADLSAKNAEK